MVHRIVVPYRIVCSLTLAGAWWPRRRRRLGADLAGTARSKSR